MLLHNSQIEESVIYYRQLVRIEQGFVVFL